jgi:hypothetical protein
MKELKLLKCVLNCTHLLAKNPNVACWDFHPLVIADMMANLPNPCRIDQFIEVLIIFVEHQIEFLGEDEND